jgi:hypothetical protein
MPRPSIGETPVTGTERRHRYRAARAAGVPVMRGCRPANHRSRVRRWHDAASALSATRAEHTAWLDAPPANPRDSGTVAAPRVICDLDPGEPLAVEPPRGFGLG